MNNEKYIRDLVMSLPDVTEEPHFEKTSFRYKKKIFATLDTKTELLCVKLNPIQQDLFSVYDHTVVYAVPNKWGTAGWTYIDLKSVKKTVLKDVLNTAYELIRTLKK